MPPYAFPTVLPERSRTAQEPVRPPPNTRIGLPDRGACLRRRLRLAIPYARHDPVSDFSAVNSTNNAWAINTDLGYANACDKDEPYTVVCVR